MMQSAENVRSRYSGDKGRQYHARKHPNDPRKYEAVGLSRARKLQPFVGDDDDVLEYGVGTCLNLRFLRCRSKVGFDLSDAGRETAEELGIEFVTDIAALDGRQFSAVICHHVLEHVPDPLAILERIKAQLRPGGRLILCVPFETARAFRAYQAGTIDHHIYSWNPMSLGNLVHDAGFQIEISKVSPFGYEQRLAPLMKLGEVPYRAGLWVIRRLRPANEVFLVARNPRPA
jgi:SAM-dependent methyltransferase